VLAALEQPAAALPSPGVRRAIAYARVVLADEDTFADRMEEAMAIPGAVSPWYRARLELARGMWLRRHRRVAQSRYALRAARKAFTTLGARAWAERADRELAATGVDTGSGSGSGYGTHAAWTRLSPQELQIAQLAAAGLSNREIGQRLYLSHRTVGSHLYRIYPKLGITSRGQLHRVLSDPSS
jgi:DNA-binding CsgD family transcriptional regulator